jgi:hypothetical protein
MNELICGWVAKPYDDVGAQPPAEGQHPGGAKQPETRDQIHFTVAGKGGVPKVPN